MQKRYKRLTAPVTQTGDEQISLSYGINGSLRKREVTQPQQHTEYYLFNSQGNLKAYSDDVMSFAYYGYNAANTRAYKISLYNTNLWINGQQQPLNLQLQQAMFYPNTYLNFDAFGNYTKHYYNGTERIASRLGDNTTTIALNNNILEARKLQLEEQFRVDIHKLIYETVPIDLPPFMDVNALQPTGTPNDIFYYHPNHLGSTAFVTDQNQTITQGFLYAPFGEITTEYNINFGNNTIPKYSFNAKELDEETGFYYYEARYYAPPVFTSRDPLFEKYFWISPYAYCANNPVKYVDPTGCEMEVDDYKIDKQGNISLLRKTDDNFDVLYNQEQTSGIQLDKGILNNKQSAKDSRGDKYDYFKITNKEKASELFKFFTKYTEVEWSKLDCGKNLDYISTSHSETKEAGGSDLLYKRLLDKKYVKELMHSHPNASVAAPSGFLKDDKNSGDRDLAKWLYKYYPEKQIKLKVYDVKQNVIINYNDKSFWIK